jgi:hypothetical protein
VLTCNLLKLYCGKRLFNIQGYLFPKSLLGIDFETILVTSDESLLIVNLITFKDDGEGSR